MNHLVPPRRHLPSVAHTPPYPAHIVLRPPSPFAVASSEARCFVLDSPPRARCRDLPFASHLPRARLLAHCAAFLSGLGQSDMPSANGTPDGSAMPPLSAHCSERQYPAVTYVRIRSRSVLTQCPITSPLYRTTRAASDAPPPPQHENLRVQYVSSRSRFLSLLSFFLRACGVKLMFDYPFLAQFYPGYRFGYICEPSALWSRSRSAYSLARNRSRTRRPSPPPRARLSRTAQQPRG
jgi:hypothetical protein